MNCGVTEFSCILERQRNKQYKEEMTEWHKNMEPVVHRGQEELRGKTCFARLILPHNIRNFAFYFIYIILQIFFYLFL